MPVLGLASAHFLPYLTKSRCSPGWFRRGVLDGLNSTRRRKWHSYQQLSSLLVIYTQSRIYYAGSGIDWISKRQVICCPSISNLSKLCFFMPHIYRGVSFLVPFSIPNRDLVELQF